MATYADLYDFGSGAGVGAGGVTDGLRARVAVALTVSASRYLNPQAGDPAPTATQVTWAKTAIADPYTLARGFLLYLLAFNRGSTNAQITGVADATLQSLIDAAVVKVTT